MHWRRVCQALVSVAVLLVAIIASFDGEPAPAQHTMAHGPAQQAQVGLQSSMPRCKERPWQRYLICAMPAAP